MANRPCRRTRHRRYADCFRDNEPRSGPAGIDVPDLIGIEGKNINDWLKPVAGAALTFKTEGVGKPKDVILIPFYKLFDQRYTVYWKAYTDESAQKEGRAKEANAAQARGRGRSGRSARMIDTLQIGNDANEIAHQLQGDRIVHGTYNDRSFLQVNTSGFLNVRMRVLPNSPVVLMCTYWGADSVIVSLIYLWKTQKLQHRRFRI